MALVLHILFAMMAWGISFTRLIKILQRRAWTSDRVAVHIWAATFMFAMVVTLLVTPANEWIDRNTLPNFARFIAYNALMLTLYLIVTAFLNTFKTPIHSIELRLIKPFLAAGLLFLFLLYAVFVRRTEGWINNPNPTNAAEAVFQLIPFFWAGVLCLMLAVACRSYLRYETVVVARYRIFLILLTAISGFLMFVCKFLFIDGFFWAPLKGGLVQSANSILEISTILLWGSSFFHNSVYTRLDAVARGLRSWTAYRDLSFLASQLSQVCPSVGLEYHPVGFWQFVRRADYFLYQSVVRILDAKVMLADSLLDNPSGQNDQISWEKNLYITLQQAGAPQAFEDIVTAYSRIGRALRTVG